MAPAVPYPPSFFEKDCPLIPQSQNPVLAILAPLETLDLWVYILSEKSIEPHRFKIEELTGSGGVVENIWGALTGEDFERHSQLAFEFTDEGVRERQDGEWVLGYYAYDAFCRPRLIPISTNQARWISGTPSGNRA